MEEAEQNNGKLTAKWFVTQFLIVWLGTMTQYYFLIYYFFTSAVLCLALIWKKYWKLFVQYAAVSGIAGVVSCALYPIMLKHIFGGYRGRESAHKLIKGQGFGQDLKTMWAIMDRQLFNRHFGELLLILFVVTIILFVLKKTDNGKIRKLFWMSVPNFLFFLVIVRIAPYMIDRYIVPVYAVVFLLVSIWFAGVCKVILEKTSWKKYYAVPFLIIVLLSVHRMGNVEQSRYWYEERYKALAENTEGIADCMYVSGDIYNWKMWGKFLEFQQYDRLYFVDGTKWNPMSLEESGEKMVLYVDKAISEDVWKSYLTEYTQYSKYSPVYSEDYLDVYVMEKE